MTSPHRAREAEIGELLARVEAATGPSIELDKLLSEAFGDKNDHGVLIVAGRWLGIAPLSGSIDAALGLVERVLPGWHVAMGTVGEDDGRWACITEPEEPCRDFTASGPDIPLAILHALLRALSTGAHP